MGDYYESLRGLRFYTIREAAAILRMSVSWLYKATESGEIPSFRCGGRVIIDKEKLEEYILLNSSSSNPRSR
ncbi:MAG: helix-turn-helix domain-containing protein [Spirochaetota bacterium]